LEHRFIFSKNNFGLLIAVILIGFGLIINCGKSGNQESGKSPGWNYADADFQYKLLQIEINLAKTEKPYLMLDFINNRIMLKLKAAIVCDCPLNIADTDSLEMKDFIKSFIGEDNNPLRPIRGKHLFEAAEKTPDSVLQIVGEVVKVKPELLQRDIPEQFQIAWNGELKMVVKTDISGKPSSRIQNVLVRLTDALDSPLGEKVIELKIEPTAALTLYRAIEKGMPTLLIDKLSN